MFKQFQSFDIPLEDYNFLSRETNLLFKKSNKNQQQQQQNKKQTNKQTKQRKQKQNNRG